jgi:hypothetical protein
LDIRCVQVKNVQSNQSYVTFQRKPSKNGHIRQVVAKYRFNQYETHNEGK